MSPCSILPPRAASTPIYVTLCRGVLPGQYPKGSLGESLQSNNVMIRSICQAGVAYDPNIHAAAKQALEARISTASYLLMPVFLEANEQKWFVLKKGWRFWYNCGVPSRKGVLREVSLGQPSTGTTTVNVFTADLAEVDPTRQ